MVNAGNVPWRTLLKIARIKMSFTIVPDGEHLCVRATIKSPEELESLLDKLQGWSCPAGEWAKRDEQGDSIKTISAG